jgi:type II secretory pathway pseudopilin PulG
MLLNCNSSSKAFTRSGYSLIELIIIFAIIAMLSVIVVQSTLKWQRDIRLQHAVHTLEARILAAYQMAQLSGVVIALELGPDHERLTFRVQAPWGTFRWFEMRLPHRFAFQLPNIPLDHPTTGNQLREAWPNAHNQRLVIQAEGQTAGSLVISDGMRTTCTVIASRGQVRSFLWDPYQWQWRSLL